MYYLAFSFTVHLTWYLKTIFDESNIYGQIIKFRTFNLLSFISTMISFLKLYELLIDTFHDDEQTAQNLVLAASWQ